MQELIDYLKIEFQYTPQSKEKLKTILSERSFKKGDLLSCQKDMNDCFFFLKSGGARTYYWKDGKELTHSFAFDRDFLICIRSRINDRIYPEYIEFLEETQVVVIRKNPFSFDFQTQDERILLLLNRILLAYNAFLEERVGVLQHKSATKRYEWVVNRYPRLLQRATLTQIASFLGITKETLYRIRSGKYSI